MFASPRRINFLKTYRKSLRKACHQSELLLVQPLDWSAQCTPFVSNTSIARSTGADIVFVDGVRTPFVRSETDYKNVTSTELAYSTLVGITQRIDKGLREATSTFICFGKAVPDAKSRNIAKEAAVSAGFSDKTLTHTIHHGCLSSSHAVVQCIQMLRSGNANVCIAGGVENVSNVPMREIREQLWAFKHTNSPTLKASIVSNMIFSPKSWLTQLPIEMKINTEFARLLEDIARLSEEIPVSKQEHEDYATRTQSLAYQAQKDGLLTDVIPLALTGDDSKRTVVNKDTVLREVRLTQGLHDRAASIYVPAKCADMSYLTDGAAACLLTTADTAKALGLRPKAYLRAFVWEDDKKRDYVRGASQIYTTAKLLEKTGLRLTDFDVFEYHEASATQILINFKAMNSEQFCEKHLHLKAPLGAPDMDKFNRWGGSLSLGHPVGVTGIRLVTTAVNRLVRDGGRLALVVISNMNGEGHAMVVERHS